MDFLKKKPEIKKRTTNYNFNESELDEYTDIQIRAFIKEYYKDAKAIDQFTAYNVPNTKEFIRELKNKEIYISIDRDLGFNISVGGYGVWNSTAKRTLAKIIE